MRGVTIASCASNDHVGTNPPTACLLLSPHSITPAETFYLSISSPHIISPSSSIPSFFCFIFSSFYCEAGILCYLYLLTIRFHALNSKIKLYIYIFLFLMKSSCFLLAGTLGVFSFTFFCFYCASQFFSI